MPVSMKRKSTSSLNHPKSIRCITPSTRRPSFRKKARCSRKKSSWMRGSGRCALWLSTANSCRMNSVPYTASSCPARRNPGQALHRTPTNRDSRCVSGRVWTTWKTRISPCTIQSTARCRMQTARSIPATRSVCRATMSICTPWPSTVTARRATCSPSATRFLPSPIR